jgi:molybdate transport system substrate-binding protein
MDYCARKKATRVNLLGNKLVLIAAKDAKIDHVTIEPGFDLAKLAADGRVATGDMREVPVGLYAKASLEGLGAWAAVEPKMVIAGRCSRSPSYGRRRPSAACHRL